VPGGVDGVLGAGGLMVRSSPGFEPRAGQLDLARQVLDTLSQGGVLLAEAGTGTGKTLAYLAAAVVAGQRVVVSTATRNLQDQIVRKDVPSLERALGGRLDAAVLKGRQNYLCTLRLEQARSDVGWGRPAAVEADPALEVVAAWAADTQTGDRAEVAEVPEEHPVWERLTTTSETCLGATCPNVGRCFVMRARAQAERARLLVVNHALYFGDLAVRAGGGALLPDHDAVVFDEAHAIADVAAQAFGAQVSTQRLTQALDDVRTATRGLVAPEARGVVESVGVARQRGEALMTALRAAVPPGELGRTRWSADDLTPAIEALHHDADAALDGLREAIERLHAASEVSGSSAGPAEIWPPAQRRVQALRDDLCVGGAFDYVRARLGLDAPERAEVTREAAVESPFDYSAQARLYLPADLPPPDAPQFIDAVVAHVGQLTALTHGRAFVLFTSHRNLDAVHRRLSNPEARFPWPLLRQGDAPRAALVERFRATPGAVLLGTGSFWEGVDVPGDALSLVIIDKLPFEVPNDPVLQARSERFAARGGHPFMDMQVPAAALALKQGFGRLVRVRSDRGVVAVLDARLTTKSYGKRILRALPPAPVVRDLEVLRAWWGTPN
jgi:ATP-dependent DNA helicase DinG